MSNILIMYFYKKIFNYFIKLKILLCLFLFPLIPKSTKNSNKLVLFGAMNGNYYGDNSKYLYEWMLKYRTDLQPIWFTHNKNIFDDLGTKGYPVALINTFYGQKLLKSAKIGCYTHSLRDIGSSFLVIPKSIKLIALRHGKSVKKVRFARERHKLSKIEALERKKENKHIMYAISTSNFISDIQERCLLIGKGKHIVTGYPRNDMLFSPSKENKILWKEFLGDIKPKKVILYGPTWRHGREATKFFPFIDFEKKKLKNFLETKNILLLLRPHKNDLFKYKKLSDFLNKLANSSNNIKFAFHNIFPDVNSILPFVDVLISDYSALYHDFLLLDRPLVFIAYDYEDFNKQNGFLYDYFDNLPGPAISNFQELCSHLNQLCQGGDPFVEKRRLLRDKIHFYKDNRSCRRIAQLIDNILLEQ